jgi:hypothetical protein
MKTMTTDETLRKELIEKGHRRQQLYTWDKAAELLWNCIEKALK